MAFKSPSGWNSFRIQSNIIFSSTHINRIGLQLYLFDIDRDPPIVDRGCSIDSRSNEHDDVGFVTILRPLRIQPLPSYCIVSRTELKKVTPARVGVHSQNFCTTIYIWTWDNYISELFRPCRCRNSVSAVVRRRSSGSPRRHGDPYDVIFIDIELYIYNGYNFVLR